MNFKHRAVNAAVFACVVSVFSVFFDETIKQYLFNKNGLIISFIPSFISLESVQSRLLATIFLCVAVVSVLCAIYWACRTMWKLFCRKFRRGFEFQLRFARPPNYLYSDFPTCEKIDQYFPAWKKPEDLIAYNFPWARSFIVIEYGSSANGNGTTKKFNDIDYCILLIGFPRSGDKIRDFAGKHDGRHPLFDIEFCDYTYALRHAAIGDPAFHSVADGQLVAGSELFYSAYVDACKRMSVDKVEVLNESRRKLAALYDDFCKCREDLGTYRVESVTEYNSEEYIERVKESNPFNYDHARIRWGIKAYLVVCCVLQITILERNEMGVCDHGCLSNLCKSGYLLREVSELKSLGGNPFGASDFDTGYEACVQIIDNYKLKTNAGRYMTVQDLKNCMRKVVSDRLFTMEEEVDAV